MRFTMLLLITSQWTFGQSNSDEQQIRYLRNLSNQAIARHDSLDIAEYWTMDFVLISSGNVEIHGREAARQIFTGDFKSRKDVVYIRTPESIHVFDAWNMASETGMWIGKWMEPDGQVNISGTYYAKWHRIEGHWKIRAEVFTPLGCSGSKLCEYPPILK